MNILDNSIDTLLGEIGLNESERVVYFAGKDKTSTSAELLRKTKMPRPTLMAALSSLRDYGLCKAKPKDGRSMTYTMQPVTTLKQYLGQQARDIDALMERLDTAPTEVNSLTITEREGQEGLKDLLELALRCRSRQWQIIAPHKNALRFMGRDYTEYFKRVRSERQIVSQTLWGAASKDQQLALKDVLMRKPRYVPADVAKEIPTLLLAFDDSLLVIEGTTNPKVALIQGRAVTQTYQLTFELAWRSLKG